MQRADVIVAGGGPVGLFAALVLSGKGLKVEVFEEQWRSASRSYALALHPESLRLLDSIGLAGRLLEQGNRVGKLRFRSDDEVRAEIDVGRLGGDFSTILVLPQHLLEETLVDALKKKGVEVHWNHRLAGLETHEGGVKARIDRLAKESAGYSVARTEWVVDRSFDVQARFLLGADGHRSIVRRRIGFDFPEVDAPLTFAVFEFSTRGASGDAFEVVLRSETTNLLWPLPGGSFRWGFQLTDFKELADPRVKSRLFVELKDERFPHVDEGLLYRLVEERAPWFKAEIEEVVWSAAVRFERRRVGRLGKGPVWLVGDAAHLASPAAIRSMNMGLREAGDWADRVGRLLRENGSTGTLEEFDSRWRKEWSEMDKAPAATPGADPWLQSEAGRVYECIPATGADLKALAAQLGLE